MNIYKIENIKNKDCYIGSETINNSRWRTHISLLRRNIHHSIYLQRAFNKHGEDNFIFTLIETDIDDNIKLLEREQYYINTEKSKYNMCRIAGNTKGIFKTQEQKDKLAIISRKLYYSNDKSSVFTMKNKQHTEESKIKIGLGSKNKIISNETKLKLSCSMSIYKICEYNIDTLELIKTYGNIRETSDFYNVTTHKIKNRLRTKFGVFNGVILRYEYDKPVSLNNNNNKTPIFWYTKDGKYLGEFKSLTEAEKETNISVASISQSINKNYLAGGYKFSKNILGSSISIITT